LEHLDGSNVPTGIWAAYRGVLYKKVLGDAIRKGYAECGHGINGTTFTWSLGINQQVIVQDVCKGWQGADLAGIVREIATRLRHYRLTEIRGDKYAGAWIRQAFEREGIRYREAEIDKSTAYLEAEPLLTQGRVELLDHPQLIRELTLLERRPRPQGRTLVEHPHGGHDDYANSMCLAVALVAKLAA
jgi:hypothetical protein